ncbi:hypothetical protein SDC9_132466 [bioreactor metagenome]|uniref:Uncharacterized protein n=1 Tax=bioreactor metagenome TaxID=1076179 RepID=A0A645D7P6_9ZZZZ
MMKIVRLIELMLDEDQKNSSIKTEKIKSFSFIENLLQVMIVKVIYIQLHYQENLLILF